MRIFQFLWLVVFCSSHILLLTHAARFAVTGPIITVTLKDAPSSMSSLSYPSSSSSSSSSGYGGDGGMVTTVSSSSSSSSSSAGHHKKWVDIAGLNPNLLVSVQSLSAPLPNWLPSLTSIRGNIGYRYNELKKMPSFIEGAFRFSYGNKKLAGSNHLEVQLQPSHEFESKQSNLLLQISRGASSYLLARFSTGGSSSSSLSSAMSSSFSTETSTTSTASSGTTTSTIPTGLFKAIKDDMLDYVRGSYHINLPYSSFSSIRITPAYDFPKQEPSCNIEVGTGGSGRTKAVLNLEYNNPTLSVVHSLDEKNVIAPEISLYTARIIYHWNVMLGEGSSIKTKVDPTSAIHVTWMDKSMSQNGRWVTDFKLPLEGTTLKALAADIKVRRQFNF